MTASPELTLDNGILRIAGEVSCWTVGTLVGQLRRLEVKTIASVDCAAIAFFDSSAVALLIYIMRAAGKEDFFLPVTGVPEGLLSLAHLYGVEAFLQLHQAG